MSTGATPGRADAGRGTRSIGARWPTIASRTAEKLLREPEVLEDALDPWLLGLEEGRELI